VGDPNYCKTICDGIGLFSTPGITVRRNPDGTLSIEDEFKELREQLK
jgi:hypothetical protein